MVVQKMDLWRKLVLICSVIFFLLFLLAVILRFFFAYQGTTTTPIPKSFNIKRYVISPIKISKGVFNQIEAVKNSNVIYVSGAELVAGSHSSLYKSSDSGKTWDAQVTPTITSISALNEKVVYVGSIDRGMGKTIDGGKTWVPNGLGHSQVIQVQAVSANTTYAITTDQYVINGGSLFKTEDGGTRWKEIYSSNWSAPITFHAVNKDVLYVAVKRGLISNSKILKTTDGGSTWSTVYIGPPNIHIKRVFAVDENTVFVATSIGVLKTLDGGANWYMNTNNLPYSFENKEYAFTGLYALSAQVAYVTYGFPYSVYVTHDGGGYWQNVNMGGSVTSINGFGTTIYVGTQQALFQLKDEVI